MGTIQKSKFFSLALAVLLPALAGCRSAPVTAVTAPEAPPEPRRPDGVVLDPPPAIPLATDRAGARGVVALREPLGDDAMFDVVRAFVSAFQREDADALIGLLTFDAVLLDAKGTKSRSAIVDGWRARFRNLDYSKLVGTEVVDLDSIERYTAQNAAGANVPARPAEMREGDVLLRIPVAAARVAGERYFGDVITMMLRREGERYRIAALGEEDAP
ncbi:hypothetical protein LVJ94_22170 [Pendulispora rubella]|uniref:Nuclear transport factor 2 family protein n=1 Tax=Pendulispora rubella TaxID=2741070 RepID=A0ABZ2LG67_9BACT